MQNVKKGDIWYCQTKNGNNVPVLVLSDMEKKKDGFVLVCAITHIESERNMFMCEIKTTYPSLACVHNIRSIPQSDLVEYMHSCTGEEMKNVNHCLRLVLGLEVENASAKKAVEEEEDSFWLDIEKNGKDIAQLEAERNVYKNLYQELLEKMIAR